MTNKLNKSLNKEKHLNLLISNNIDWIWKNPDLGHVEIQQKGYNISFWLGSGKWIIHQTQENGCGFFELQDFLKNPKTKTSDEIIAELRHQVSVLSEALAKYEDKPIEEYFV